jgi:hypothetical protein
MVHRTSIAWKIALAFLLGAAVVFASPVMGAHAWASAPRTAPDRLPLALG